MFGIIVFLLAVNVNHVQKLILKKAERLLDESVHTGIVEYHYSVDGIESISQLVISKNYWTAYKGYATKGQYIYEVTIVRVVLFYIMGSKGVWDGADY